MALKCLTDLDGKPKLEIEFESEQLAYDFYNKYALKMRFSIRKHAFSKNKKASEMTSTIFVYSKERFHKKNKRDLLSKKLRT